FIGRRHFIDLLERHPKLSVRLLGVLCTRLRWTSEIIEDTVFRDIRSRLARRLLSLAHVYGTEVADGTRIKLRISQENLGRMMGATRESINKELGAWQSQGVIGYSRGHITIRDAEVLERLANLA
ncbi:MAG: Crp/Fnr family transcriptional regulator, partial [Alphaproteobacteria bacterium]|nr:Crp/Fnr family transcriptional regulator [Alphaproteobacteria bacterium]